MEKIRIGNDAILLHDLCGLKLTCFGYKVCKVAMPADNLADKCYRKIITGNEIYIVGKLETSGEIEIQKNIKFMVKFDPKKNWEKCCFFFFIWYNRTDILYRRNFG